MPQRDGARKLGRLTDQQRLAPMYEVVGAGNGRWEIQHCVPARGALDHCLAVRRMQKCQPCRHVPNSRTRNVSNTQKSNRYIRKFNGCASEHARVPPSGVPRRPAGFGGEPTPGARGASAERASVELQRATSACVIRARSEGVGRSAPDGAGNGAPPEEHPDGARKQGQTIDEVGRAVNGIDDPGEWR